MADSQERRRFFRLDDQVVLDFKPLSAEQYKTWQKQNKVGKKNRDLLDKEIGNLMHRVKSQNPDLGRLLELFNQKINQISSQAANSAGIDMPHISDPEGLTRINLSACGMSFQSDKPYKRGEFILLSMILKPSNTPVSLAGQVVAVDMVEHSKKPYKVRLNFPDIQEAEQELLIQHLFQLQSKQLKREQELNQ